MEKKTFITSGGIIGNNPERKRWKNYEFPKKVGWLSGAKVLSHPFLIDYELATTIIYPNELEWPRKNKRYPEDPTKDKEHIFMGEKILLVSDPNPSWGKRVKVAIERRGYYASNTFYLIKLKQDTKNTYLTTEAVAAVLDWYICNAWVVEHLKYPWIEKRIIENIPFPSNLNEADCKILTDAIIEFEKAAVRNLERPLDATEAIDSILKLAYRLDDDTFKRLQLLAKWDTNTQFTIDQIPDGNPTWKTSGIVDSIDVENGTITFWLSDFDELQTVTILPQMPGWLLRPDIAFRTTIPRDCLKQQNLKNVFWGNFYPQEYTYLDEKELIDDLTNVFHPNQIES